MGEWWQESASDAMFADCPFGLGILAPDGTVLAVNRALADLHDVPADTRPGTRALEVSGPLSHPEVLASLLRAGKTGEPHVDRVIRGRVTGVAHSYVCSFAIWPLRGDGGVRGVGITFTDITGDTSALTRMEQVRARLALVNEAELRMGFSRDVVGCAEQVPLVVVPSFADAAAVGLFDAPVPISMLPEQGFDPPPGTLLRTVAAVVDPKIPDLPVLSPRDYGRPFPVPPEVRAALRRQRAELSGVDPHETPTVIGQATPDAPPLRTHLLKAGMHSRIVAPLIARGRAIGMTMFARLAGSPPFEADDLQTAEELGLRAASSIDNAQAHVRQRHAVRTLQRHLLPRDLPEVPGLSFAYAYQPARAGRLAGGDWYDVIPLSEGCVAMVVGDVTGHGLQAAALMGQLRVAVRAVARLELPPAALLAHVDSLMDDFAVDGELASCVYTVYDPKSRTLTWARAGHPPPLLLSPGERPRVLGGPANALLGLGGITFEQTSYSVAPGSTVVLYSDGLVERRGRDIDTGIDDLTGVLDAEGADASPNRLREAALRVLPADPEDDVALLIARLT
ncbi:MAG: SpoIIE family protein phosphatase [Streptomycetaceae bacterium]|nr:SpoIIE family protein phosphatase [Streptomycetaceae bacterium]